MGRGQLLQPFWLAQALIQTQPRSMPPLCMQKLLLLGFAACICHATVCEVWMSGSLLPEAPTLTCQDARCCCSKTLNRIWLSGQLCVSAGHEEPCSHDTSFTATACPSCAVARGCMKSTGGTITPGSCHVMLRSAQQCSALQAPRSLADEF